MASPFHSKQTGNDAVHPATYVASSDPASPDTSVTADGKLWIDTTTGTTFATGWLLKIRAGSNTVWTTILDLMASLALKANLASPTFTGTPAAPTAAPGTNTTQIATTAFVAAAAAVAYTDEQAQDAVGGIVANTTTINLSYSDGTPSISGVVNDGSITYAKIQDVSATDRLLGRSTAGSGDVEEIVCTATARSILDDTSTAAVLATIGARALAPTITTLTDGATVTWTVTGLAEDIAQLTIAGTRTLAITGASAGFRGVIHITESGASRSLALPGSSVVANSGAGVIALTGSNGGKQKWTVSYDGSTYWWEHGDSYT